MSNVSHINPSPVSKAIRPVTGRPSSLPSQLGPSAPSREDAVELSSDAARRTPTSEAPFRADLVEQIRADLDAGRLDAEITDEKFEAILPALLADLRDA